MVLPSECSVLTCSFRHCNLRFLQSKLGSFDIIVVDPPWKSEGSAGAGNENLTRERRANANTTFAFSEIQSLPIESFSESGLCFLWVSKRWMQEGFECLTKWGYDYIDKLTLIKRQTNSFGDPLENFQVTSTDNCLIGLKKSSKGAANLNLSFTPEVDVLFEDSVGPNAVRPEKFYSIID